MTEDAAWVDDDEDYEDAEGAAAPGLAVTALASAAGALIGLAAGGPAGAAVGGAAPPYLALGFQKLVNAIAGDKTRRADRMLQEAADAAGLTPEQLVERAGETEQTRFLTDKAIQAAADTIWPEGVRAIGRAYAAGLLAKDKPVLDVRLRVLGIMKDLDELHVRLLDLLVRCEPDFTQEQVVAVPHRDPSYVDTYRRGARPDNPRDWSAGRRVWRTEVICALMPEIEQVLPSLLGELRESGLAKENDAAPGAIEHLSKQVADQMNQQAGLMRSGKQMKQITPSSMRPNMRRLAESTWSPTELGEKVLGFYAEAGADGQDQG